MFLTPAQTSGPLVFALRRHNSYLAMERGPGGGTHIFDIECLEEALGQGAATRGRSTPH